MFPTIDNIKKIQELVEQGYINKRKHPIFPYFIYNYTSKTQYEAKWCEETLNCRGLILDQENNIISKPFRKFFNYEEYEENSKLGNLPEYTDFQVFEKLDGSCGIMYITPNNDIMIATRGSFESEQATEASVILNEKYKKQLDVFRSLNNFTFIFEIIYKNNRIVVDYGDIRDIILLAVIDNETGNEWTYEELESFSKRWLIPLVRKYNGIKDFTTIKKDLSEDNSEGFVIKFDTGLRIKLKFDEYCRLHRLLTGVSNKSIWELLRNHQDIDELLDRVPDEFYNWVKKTKDNFLIDYKSIEAKAIITINPLKLKTDRKEVALEIVKKHKKLKGLLFAMLDDKPYQDIIWKMLRPEYSKPFAEEK